MVNESALKVIPLVKNPNTRIQLSHAFNVRVQHPDIIQVMPWSTSSIISHNALAVLVAEKDPSTQAFDPLLKLHLYTLNTGD